MLYKNNFYILYKNYIWNLNKILGIHIYALFNNDDV